MIEEHIDIETKDGAMNTFITRPDRGGPFPVIVFLMDAPGKREELHDMARRIATVGYYVMLPNLYYRQVRDFVVGPETREVMFGYMNALSNDIVCEDVESLLKHAAQAADASDGPAGTLGYCMSGPFSFSAAAAFPDRIKAAASLYGVRLCVDTPSSPHLRADKVQGELYFACAETDDWAPPEMVQALDDHLAKAGVRYTIEWYPGTHHGFAFPGRGEIYDKAAAERHWSRLFALFARNL
ncbi:MAG: hydrolase [Gammaproteobacteria bacterium]|nr:hydrolase [Gammaproteobacteria bacterium]|tara:strand:- start:18 stop:737 length:720 start_codon:yes stop_codon:yes gene_type:complete